MSNAGKDIRSIINNIVQRLVMHYAPRKIILFGSWASGGADEDSDIDLLIIKDTPEAFLQRMDTVRKVATGTHRCVPFDPIVLTPAELDQRLKAQDQFIAAIVRNGEVLYAA